MFSEFKSEHFLTQLLFKVCVLHNIEIMGKIKFLAFLLLLGIILYYCGKPSPMKSLQNDLSKIGSQKKSKEEETQNQEEETTIEEETSSITDDVSKKIKEKVESSVLETIQEKVFGNKPKQGENNDGGTLDEYIPFSKLNTGIVRHKAFILNYREEYEQASWVLHRLDKEAMDGREARSNEFIEDPLVETGSAHTRDYSRSGYDRGHLCPAADFKHNKELQDETFYMSNMSPQNPDFNRGIWSNLEDKIRRWVVDRENLIILTGPILQKGLETIGKSNKIAVPQAFYKIVYDIEQEQAIAFLISNEGSSKSIKSFVVSIDYIEKLTSIDFFEKLPDDLEQKIESKVNLNGWF